METYLNSHELIGLAYDQSSNFEPREGLVETSKTLIIFQGLYSTSS